MSTVFRSRGVRATTIHRHRCAAAVIAGALACGLAACSDDVGSSSANQTDSFTRPTNHGTLSFGAPNDATFDASHRFHAWEFSLTGQATLDLRTQLDAVNLDTVMYLYRRDAGAQSWGAYVASNDDSAGNLWSRIAGGYDVGEYRVLVKATKTAMVGDFAVLATCTGEGCPASQGICNPAEPSATPSETSFTASCNTRFLDVVLSPVASSAQTSFAYDDRCTAGDLVGKAVDYYREFFDANIEWGDIDDGNPELNAQIVSHGEKGTVIELDMNADEDHVQFVFDDAQQLIALFNSASFSVEQWFCGLDGEPTITAPADLREDCLGDALSGLQHQEANVRTGQGTTTVASPDAGLPAVASAAVAAFAELAGIDTATAIAYSFEQWQSVDDRTAAQLTLSAADKTVVYLVTESWYDEGSIILLSAEQGAAWTFVCSESTP